MRRGPWLLVAVAGAVVLVLLIAVVVQGGDGPSARDRLAAVAGEIEDAGTVHLSMRVVMDDAGTPAATGDGAVELASGAGWFTVGATGQGVEMRTDGTTLFARPSGEPMWQAAPAAAIERYRWPAQVLPFLEVLGHDVDVDVEDRGEDELAGRTVRRLELTVGADEVPGLGQIAPEYGSVAIDLWVDRDGLPIRQRVRGVVAGVPFAMVVDLDRWGEPLDAAIPPREPVRGVPPDDLARLLGDPGGTVGP